jgi:hypothetical protein
MSGQSIHQLLSSLANVGTPEPENLAELLGTTLTLAQENPSWLLYKFELSDGIFAGGELRVGKSGGMALLILTPVEEPGLFEKDLDLAAWGEPRAIDVNPRIPPEGTDAYIYDIEGVKLSLQWTHSSRRLRSVALEWAEGD